MSFVTSFLKNLGLLIVIGVVLLVLFPNVMSQIFQMYGALFGPGVIILLVVVAALPRPGGAA